MVKSLQMFLLSGIKKSWLVLLIGIFLFIIPFFWLAPGEMDLGGDSSRLYFYDPLSFIKAVGMYDVLIQGKGSVYQNYSLLPYAGLLLILKYVFPSPTVLIVIVNGLKLAGGFIAIYLIVCQLLKESYEKLNKTIYFSAILSGIFYIASLNSIHMFPFWNRALTAHNEVFLNPLMFYLIFKFFLSHEYIYLWISLIISFIFSPNFGFSVSPSFFAFYPLAIIFLFIYSVIFVKKAIPWMGIIFGLLLFLGVQSFHLIGQMVDLLDPGSFASTRVFDKEAIRELGVNYFISVSPHGKAILNLLLPSANGFLKWTSLAAPLVMIVGFLLDKGKRKEYLLVAFFFIITFFLVTANITNIGFEFYKKLFYIPGFSMFRLFFEKWLFVFLFFYSLLIGFSIHAILVRFKPLYAKFAYSFIFFAIVFSGIPLFAGSPVKESIIERGSNNIKTTFVMDPKYEKTLEFIRSLPDDGKIMMLPLTDFYLQVISGANGGAYEGPSTLRYLTWKYSFVGYQNFGYENKLPYAEDVMKYSREKNYDRLLRIFNTLNIRYIFHNTDPMAYEKGFNPGPYGYMQTSLPKTQDEYKEFLQQFPLNLIYKNGSYLIYEINKSVYNSTIFVPDGVYQSSKLSFDADKTHSVFVDKDVCGDSRFKNLCNVNYKKPDMDIELSMINPTLYSVNIKQRESVDSVLLVMQHTFHKGWKVMVDKKYIAEDSHILVNGYANGWLINSEDLPKDKSYKLFIKLDPQKYFWYGWIITLFSLTIVLAFFTFSMIYYKKVFKE